MVGKVHSAKEIWLCKKSFPSGDGDYPIGFTEKALLRAVVTAGQKPTAKSRTKPAQADIDMRLAALKSALEMSGSSLVPTSEFLASGRTDKAHKAFYVGNALCSHAAYIDLNIPWLVDIERLSPRYSIQKRAQSNRRPDFLGLDQSRRWYVFESKGRSSQPTKPNLADWKLQANAIRAVNGKAVTQNIVSAAYITRQIDWRILWVDPPEEPNAEDVRLDDLDFFRAYYAPVLALLDRNGEPRERADRDLRYIAELNAFVGVRPEVLGALQAGDPSAIVAFAETRVGDAIGAEIGEVSVFADGLMIMLGPNWGSSRNVAVPQLPQSEQLSQ